MSKTYINIQHKFDRTVVLVDMDCFYCQVEENLNPELQGKPIAVVQYNAWQGGGIIAVNYVARAKGVTRYMRGEEATELCPEIVLCKVPSVRGKADLTKYREAGKEVAAVLQTFTPLLERASVDEAYLDISENVKDRLQALNEGKYQLQPQCLTNSFAVGYETFGVFVKDISKTETDENLTEDEKLIYKKSDIKLLIGAAIVNEIRAEVKNKTGYDCSAGIAHNKILAKLTAGMNKPNKQTVLPLRNISMLYSQLPVGKVKGLGGKFGEAVCEKLKIKLMSELTEFLESDLQKNFDEKNGSWLYLMARGIDLECVTPKYISKSIGCCKRFPGRNAINAIATLNHWLGELASEIFERLEKDVIENCRTSKLMTVSFTQEINNEDVASSRSVPLPLPYDQDRITKEAFETIKRNTEIFTKTENPNTLNNAIKFLGISCSKFENNPDSKEKNKLQALFNNHSKKVDVENAPECSKTIKNDEAVVKRKSAETVTKSDIMSFFKNHTKKPSETTESSVVAEEVFAVETSDTVVETIEEPATVSSFFKTNKNDDVEEPKFEDQKLEPLEPANIFDAEYSVDAENEDEQFEQSPASPENIKIAAHLENDEKPASPVPSTSKDTDYRQTYVEFQCPSNLKNLFIKCPDCNKNISECDYTEHTDWHVAMAMSQKQREEFRQDLKKKITSPVIGNKAKARNSSVNKTVAKIENFLVKQTRFPTSNLECVSQKNKPNKLIDSFLVRSSRSVSKEQQNDDIKMIEQSSRSPVVGSPTKAEAVDAKSPSPKASVFRNLLIISTPPAPCTANIGTDVCEVCNEEVPIQWFIEHMDHHKAEEEQAKWNNLDNLHSEPVKSVIIPKSANNQTSNKRKRSSSGNIKNSIKVKSLTSYFSKET